MASAQCQKPTTTNTEICQPKSHHSSFGQKISEMTSKAFKGHHGRHGSNQNQIQCYSQTQTEYGHGNSKTETHRYSQTQTKHHKNQGVTKTQITICVVQAQITQTNGNPAPYGTNTACFGTPSKKNGEHHNNKERNLFRRIKDGISRHNSDGSSSSSSESDSDNEECPKTKPLQSAESLKGGAAPGQMDK